MSDHGDVGSRQRRRERERRATLGPPVHVEVVAPVDLKGLASLIKPAVLYADQVTIHSPAAALLHGVTQFAELTEPADQLEALVEVSRQAPSALPFDFDATVVAQLGSFLRLTPVQRRRLGQAAGVDAQFRELEAMVHRIRVMWETEMPVVIEKILDMTGADDLVDAIEAGVIEIAPLAKRASTDHVAGTVAAAAATGDGEGQLDPMFDGFLETLVEIVTSPSSFPLLDADATGLVRSMERESVLVFGPPVATRGAEVDAATRFMAYLPYFPDMPLADVLDLRREIDEPLVRFRGEMTKLSNEFARPVDDRFAAEVESAWRARIAPALADIRESLADHGLLREVSSVVRGDVRQLATEAGGVIAASHTNLIDLSGLLTLGAVAAVPALHTIGKAVNGRISARRDVEKQGFYFLHKIDSEARRRREED